MCVWPCFPPLNGGSVGFLPPANEVCEGYVFTGVCLSTWGSLSLSGGSLSQEGLCLGGPCPGGLCLRVSVQGVYVWGSLCTVGSVQECLCPGGSLSGGLCPGRSLSGGSLSRGISVQGILCPGGFVKPLKGRPWWKKQIMEEHLCPGRSLSGGLCPGESLSGGLCPGGLCPGGFCLGEVSVWGVSVADTPHTVTS